jgi:RNA polymerase sigma-70 factor, ECF subfamily
VDLSDELLMTRFGRGDEASFRELVARHHHRLLNFIFRRTGSRELAEDIVQDTFLRVVNAAPRYQATAKFTTWLYTIALNVWRNEMARRRMPAQLSEHDCVQESVSMDQQVDFRRLRELMQDLSEDHCLVLELGFVEGWTNQQIADLMDCSVGTVKSRKFYALKALRKRMGINQDERMSECAAANG